MLKIIVKYMYRCESKFAIREKKVGQYGCTKKVSELYVFEFITIKSIFMVTVGKKGENFRDTTVWLCIPVQSLKLHHNLVSYLGYY